IPLCLAWALTVHKSQSQSLNKVIMDLDKAFMNGMYIYVTLSWTKSKEGLEIRHFKEARGSVIGH
ncbi:uncharacterized protein EDB91DRAFT_1062930, partial [Suillus paluster]|uniref:uncharacterized protein n=1 Tax=Suillus paluster TaxID=48578 RepID=UPI001B87FF4F